MKKLVIGAALLSLTALSAPSYAAELPTIPIIVKDTTSFYWQIVLAGARKAGQDLGVKVPELGAQSELDITGQISILENAVAEKPAAVVIAPTQFKLSASRSMRPRRKCRSSGWIGGGLKAFISFLTTDNVPSVNCNGLRPDFRQPADSGTQQ